MYLVTYFINPLMAIVSILTSTGVFLHDTQLDKATVTAMAPPAIVSGNENAQPAFQKGDPHTHSERGSLSQALRDLRASNPRIQPRRDEERHEKTSGELPFRGAFDMRASFFDPDYLS